MLTTKVKIHKNYKNYQIQTNFSKNYVYIQLAPNDLQGGHAGRLSERRASDRRRYIADGTTPRVPAPHRVRPVNYYGLPRAQLPLFSGATQRLARLQ